ncbi:MAG: hypothetical protein H6739_28855 [Alphaproteobacteria bacterium]|nr:hypothetical protein [Alphaproteobacteria bacterium]
MRSPRIARAAFLLLAVCAVAWAATDEEYERGAGLTPALTATPPTLTADADIQGQTYTINPALGIEGCTVDFAFQKAMTGTSPYPAAPGRTVNGVYVKIHSSFSPVCERVCESVTALQVLRNTTTNADGERVTDQPTSRGRRARSGSDDPTAASQGWRVDSGGTDPRYGTGDAVTGSMDPGSETGSAQAPLIVRDAPGHWNTARSAGKDFYTCAVCENPPAQAQVLGCVHWGYFIDASGHAAFDPKPPTTHATAPQQVQDALTRFEGISGNTSYNIPF